MSTRRFEIILAVCALCRHNDRGFCRMRLRTVLEMGHRNVVECSWLREIMTLVDEGGQRGE